MKKVILLLALVLSASAMTNLEKQVERQIDNQDVCEQLNGMFNEHAEKIFFAMKGKDHVDCKELKYSILILRKENQLCILDNTGKELMGVLPAVFKKSCE